MGKNDSIHEIERARSAAIEALTNSKIDLSKVTIVEVKLTGGHPDISFHCLMGMNGSQCVGGILFSVASLVGSIKKDRGGFA